MGIKNEKNYAINANYVVNLLNNEKNYLLANNSLISENSYSNHIIDRGNGRTWIRMNASTETNYIIGSTNNISYQYDEFGNIIQTLQENNTGIYQTSNFYSNNGSLWIKSKLTRSESSNKIFPNTNFEGRISEFIYNANGTLLSKTTDPGDIKSVTTNFIYDGFGNVIKSQTSAVGVETIENEVVFDSKGRMPIRKINQQNQTTFIENDSKWAKPKKIIAISGLITTFEYNQYGAMIRETNPYNQTSEISSEWDITNNNGNNPQIPRNTLFKIVEKSPNTPETTTWFDKIGREVVSKTIGQPDEILVVQKYDNKGNVITKTSPFTPNSGVQAVVFSYTYDNLNRISTIFDGFDLTSYTYSGANGLATSTVSNSKGSTTQVKDAGGKLISSADNGGTINYTYTNFGLQKDILFGQNVISHFEYDLQGNQTSLFDQNAGITSYEYDAYGRLLAQTDPNTSVQNLQYDAFGRVIRKNTNSLITNYEYVNETNGINQVKKISNANNAVSKEYTYDAYSNLIQEKITVDGIDFINLFSYNNAGQNTSITYPSGYEIDLIYNANGYLQTVKSHADNKILFNNPTSNAFGSFTHYTLGNGKTTNNKYTRQGLPEEFKTNGVQFAIYTFNTLTNNLTSKTDQIANLKESYVFDNLNRLTQAKTTNLNGQTVLNTINIVFASNGNILSKTGIGNYTYDDTKKNAVVGVQNSSQTISPQTQNITYTDFDRVSSISENGYELNFVYDTELDRIKTELKHNDQIIETKYFLGSYEKIVTNTNGVPSEVEVHYLPTGSIAYVVENGVPNYYYL